MPRYYDLDSANYPYTAHARALLDRVPFEPDEDCFDGDCDPSDDEYRYPEGARRVDAVLYDGDN